MDEKLKTTFINHTGQWLKTLYTVTSVTDQDDPSYFCKPLQMFQRYISGALQ